MHKRLAKELAQLPVDADVQEIDSTTWLVHVAGPDGSPYHGARFSLRCEFPKDYPFGKPKVMLASEAPAHLNVSPDGILGCSCPSASPFFCGCSDWTPTMMVRELPAAFQEYLLQVTANPEQALWGSLSNPPLTEVYRRGHEVGSEYWITAAGSAVGSTVIPAWTQSTHSNFPPVVRARVRAMLLTLRLLERRYAPPVSSPPWPADVMHQIIARVVANMWAEPDVRAALRRVDSDARALLAQGTTYDVH